MKEKKIKEKYEPKIRVVDIEHLKNKWEATQIGNNVLRFKKPADMEWKEVFDQFLYIHKSNSL